MWYFVSINFFLFLVEEKATPSLLHHLNYPQLLQVCCNISVKTWKMGWSPGSRGSWLDKPKVRSLGRTSRRQRCWAGYFLGLVIQQTQGIGKGYELVYWIGLMVAQAKGEDMSAMSWFTCYGAHGLTSSRQSPERWVCWLAGSETYGS